MIHLTPFLLLFLSLFLTVSLTAASTIVPRTSSELETADTEATNMHKDFFNLLNGPLIPAAFMKSRGARNKLRCNKASPYVDMDSEVFVEELPSPQIESEIREIINTFVETLKHDKSWFVSLLFQIRKEQKRRESEACSEAECIYKIPCYLSQSFLSLSMYSEMLKRARVKEGFDLLSRRRRSLDGLEAEAEYSSLVSGGKAPVTNCTGIFANYCYNSISCIYVSVLESAACSCMPGYTGLRCDLYDLSITLATLSQFRTTTVDIEVLRPEDSATMYSVLDATA
ncbi:unnamed protein product [Hydatigera taeniaeformis]|uniref:EGF-like domain-containing protein n=1 Tax=Hydatigena taeniaeformis TaxID=6205 RepID=A0A0R3WKG5_HYDTA|nr:unnamed protein product [Hydatigera taeniaeformis]